MVVWTEIRSKDPRFVFVRSELGLWKLRVTLALDIRSFIFKSVPTKSVNVALLVPGASVSTNLVFKQSCSAV